MARTKVLQPPHTVVIVMEPVVMMVTAPVMLITMVSFVKALCREAGILLVPHKMVIPVRMLHMLRIIFVTVTVV
jgi:hypothetical protein